MADASPPLEVTVAPVGPLAVLDLDRLLGRLLVGPDPRQADAGFPPRRMVCYSSSFGGAPGHHHQSAQRHCAGDAHDRAR